jgi:hypothetical protein
MRNLIINPELLRWLLSVIVPAIAGFLGVVVGAWLSARREKGQRRYAFRERQLQDFYSPLLGLRTEVRARSEIRDKVHDLTKSEWGKLANEARQSPDPQAESELWKSERPAFERVYKYSDKQFNEELIPTYRKMLSIFRDNLWLAEPETRPFFKILMEYVDFWERCLAWSLPAEVTFELDSSESKLQPFFDHLESKHDELRTRLSGGSV